MTLPNERYYALEQTREFLRRLLDPRATPKVPKWVRKEAYWCLRHYPHGYEVWLLAEHSPTIIKHPEKCHETIEPGHDEIIGGFTEEGNGPGGGGGSV